MKLDKGRISALQLMFLIAGYMQGSMFVTNYIFANSSRDAWLLILVASAVFLPFALVYIKLSNRFPDDNLVQINDKVFGKVIGKALSVLYCIFFFILCALNFRFPSAFLVSVFMLDTPMVALLLVFFLLCAWAVKDGIETLSRLSFFTTIITFGAFLIYFTLLFNKIQIPHFFPILDMPPVKIIENLNAFITIYMGEIFIFAMVIPHVSDRENIKKNYLYGAAIGVLTFFIGAVMVTGVMGNMASISTGPLTEATRYMELSNIKARIEFLFMGVLIINGFMKSCVLYYVSLLSAGHILNLRSYRDFVVPLGLVFLGMAMTVTENIATNIESAKYSWPYISYLIMFALPLLTLITAIVRKLPKSRDGETP